MRSLALALLLLAGCGASEAGALRPSDDYYRKIIGTWTTSQYNGGVGGGTHWVLSFGRDYSVFIRTPDGQTFRGSAEMRFDLGADTQGRIRMPPGSTLLDVRIEQGPESAHSGQYLLGAINRSDRYLVPKNVLNACLGAPGGSVRATAFTDPVPGVRCFELFPVEGVAAEQVAQLAGSRARDGEWRVAKAGDAAAYIVAHGRNLANFGTFYMALMAALGVAALLYWKIRGSVPADAMPLAVRLFPYLGPRLRIALWTTLLGSMLLAALPLLLFFFPQFMVIVAGYHVFSRFSPLPRSARASLKPASTETTLPWKLGTLCLALIIGLGLLAPANLTLVGIHHLLGQPPEGALFDLVATPFARLVNRWSAFAGAAAVTLFIATDAFWRLHQARTLSTLATSSVAGASHGLVELAGTARPAGGMPGDGPQLLRWTETTAGAQFMIEPFDLENADGTIRVDPRGASFNPGWIGDLAHAFLGFHEIALNGRVEVDEKGDSITRTLEIGDPVFVIGHARWQRDQETGREFRVVGPSGAGSMPPLGQLLYGGHGVNDVFFLSDSDEEGARSHLLSGFRRVWLTGFAWLGASAWLYWLSS